ncbi:YciE/YciF ferroxidase family protein [Chitinophaga rhizophila]|uniref:Ferritin-like domain-containing protein n=1 Tax=Chitinophaga rhizophila TaxID=2866212 RepID=A0ABS7G7L7_9BACT|nr:ferritin-like domain-containing protein [Chitinophaga rhizophila]MBW8683635.1 ferritin-like domain-containing protein [Chitinophaga rhizophila]
MSKTSSTTARTTVIKGSGTARKGAESAAQDTAGASALTTDTSLKDFFCEELKDIYWAENHITIALPKMIKAAGSPELQTAFQDHLAATATHISRLEQIFTILGKPVRGKKCDAIEGIVLEGESIIADTLPGTATRDVGLVFAAQKVEHYEIASYGGLAQLAKTLGLQEVASLLEETLAEEKETDALLTQIAESSINGEAAAE